MRYILDVHPTGILLLDVFFVDRGNIIGIESPFFEGRLSSPIS